MNEWQISYLILSAQITCLIISLGIWPLAENEPPKENKRIVSRWKYLGHTFLFLGVLSFAVCLLSSFYLSKSNFWVSPFIWPFFLAAILLLGGLARFIYGAVLNKA